MRLTNLIHFNFVTHEVVQLAAKAEIRFIKSNSKMGFLNWLEKEMMAIIFIIIE